MHLRRALSGLTLGGFTMDPAVREILSFERGPDFRCVVNFTDKVRPLPGGEVLLASEHGIGLELPGNCAAWLRTR